MITSDFNRYSDWQKSRHYVTSNGAFGAASFLRETFEDSRWSGYFAVSERRADVIVPFFVARMASVHSTYLVETFLREGINLTDRAYIVLIGSTPGGFPGYLFRADNSPDTTFEGLRDALGQIARYGDLDNANLVIAHGNEDMVRALLEQRATSVVVNDGYRAVLPVLDIEKFPRKIKQTYRADIRKFEALGIRWTFEEWRTILREAGEAIIGVKSRHGLSDSILRLQEEYSAIEDEVEINGCLVTGPDERPIGGSIIWIYQGFLHVVEVGMTSDPQYAKHAYYAAVFHGPMELARIRGISAIDLGLEALTPKRARGAQMAESYLVRISGEMT
ncbi:hypothetical protein SAMN00768000_3518 [Sulfobacillus thermosulfidooxidans DSM 9293]|uniref:Phosphatidylglycerol lysyltransferase C-terminal domain-containing protein n=1 Tax=Sulfobacillus thermosulfidooxidans (strain DSM 9293 / VKM B-1269 / AT-1) TaxID=929705 RepID=A0A1W1WNS4_SULTA|nr:hypothetical protein [Sulfobacillus thermosulfidooxidans]SMC07896.1 hypothetical protein SAMN00768000_3518 [Sulfobacillus thermosulfidooxidans DSM 9293]